MKIFLLFLLPLLLFANIDDRALYIKKYKNESKTALVIGNANYKHFSKLKNSNNDANDMKNLLESKGFKVHYLNNATLRQMKKTMRNFTKDIKNGGIGMVYYAGHGVEVDGKNYLIPVDAYIPAKDEVEYEALAVDMIIDKMENAKNRLNILVLDACRNDPFSRSGSGGLASINNAKGMYVAYATAPGKVASDGKGRNGLFTKHLINEIKKPQSLEKVFKNTRIAVLEESNDRQLPWTSSSIIGEFYFTIPNDIKTTLKRKSYPKQQSTVSFQDETPKEFSLTINTTPNGAQIDLTNSDKNYYDGIKLKKGSYDIKVLKKGYYTKKGTIDLQNNLDINLELEKIIVEKTISKKLDYKTTKPVKKEYKKIYSNKTNDHIYKQLMASKFSSTNDMNIKSPDIAENGSVIPVTINFKTTNYKNVYLYSSIKENSFIGKIESPKNLNSFALRIKLQKSGKLYAVGETYDGFFYKVESKRIGVSSPALEPNYEAKEKLGRVITKAKYKGGKTQIKTLIKSISEPNSYVNSFSIKDADGNQYLKFISSINVSKNPYFRVDITKKLNRVYLTVEDNTNTKNVDFKVK